MKNFLLLAIVWATVSGCTKPQPSVYDALGGRAAIEQIVDNFIYEIQFDDFMFSHFKDSNITRFKQKMVEHICVLASGPCEYTGDEMSLVHQGMNITESQFNHSVDLLIKAMDKANIPHPVQNRLLATMAPIRHEMIYL